MNNSTNSKPERNYKMKPETFIHALFVASAASICTILSCGCSSAQPASRTTSASYDITVKVCLDENVKSTSVNVPFTFGDGALASADSSGSTESQTATPTLDIKPDINVNYAQGGGITSRASGQSASGAAGFIESLTAEGLSLLKNAVKNKTTGKITLTKKDGTTTTADCKDGSCTLDDGTTISSSDFETYETEFL